MLLSTLSLLALLCVPSVHSTASDEASVQIADKVLPVAPPPISFHHHALPQHVTGRLSSRRAHASHHVGSGLSSSIRAVDEVESKERREAEVEGVEDDEDDEGLDEQLRLAFEDFEADLFETDEEAPEPLSQAEKNAAASHARTGGASSADGRVAGAEPHSSLSTAVLDKRRAGHYIGHGTYYRAGYGACGWHNHGWEMVVALSHHHWKHGSHCGKHIKACHHGRCVRLRVVDECMGCGFGSVDMTTAAFKRLAHLRQGVIGVGWRWD